MKDNAKQQFDWDKWLEKDNVEIKPPEAPESPESPERFDEIEYTR